MFERLAKKLWGGIRGDELAKFMYLSAGAFFLIGSYWPLKPLKEGIFMSMVGSDYLPSVKMITVAVVLLFVLVSSKLVDLFSKQKMIYFFVLLYSVLGICFVFLLTHPTIGLANTIQSKHRYVAWAFFVFAESYLTIMVALFWSFVNDITSSKSAKKGYGMIVTGSQLGGFIFSLVGKGLISDTSAYTSRVPLIIGISVCMFLCLGASVWFLTHSVSKEQLQGDGSKKKRKPVGFIEGMITLIKHPYVMGIFGLVFFQEIVTTLMGFQFSRMVEHSFADPAVRTSFLFTYSVTLQFIATAFALFGTSYIHRRFGTRYCLVGLPLILLVCASFYFVMPSLYTAIAFMLLIKALHYALNQPVKETLYIPTSQDIKYKSKAWIDTMGQRGSKFFGATLSKFVGSAPTPVSLLSVGGLIIWSLIASAVGRRNEKAVAAKQLID